VSQALTSILAQGHETVGLGPFPPFSTRRTHDGYVAERRPPSRAILTEAADSLQKLLVAIEAGELDVSTPRDVALLRRLQGTLAGWNEALGKAPEDDDHTG
jgi:hypothetical protein